MVPLAHHERVIAYDRLAQVYVQYCHSGAHLGNLQQAKLYYTKAYQASILACGIDASLTMDLLKLSTNTPSSVHELQNRYSSRDNNDW